MKRKTTPDAPQSEDAYRSIRGHVIEAQGQVYTAVNAAMVTAYWKIGKSSFEACGENDRAAYGKQVLQYISEKMTAEFGKGFIYAAKYMPYLPTEEELKRELRLEGFQKLEDV